MLLLVTLAGIVAVNLLRAAATVRATNEARDVGRLVDFGCFLTSRARTTTSTRTRTRTSTIGGKGGESRSSAPEELNLRQNANDDGSNHDFSLPWGCQCGITINA
jgi:hypothetical protein